MTGTFPRPATRDASRGRPLPLLGLLWAVVASLPAAANPLGLVTPDEWRPHEAVGVLDNVVLRVHWHDSSQELRAAAAERGLNVRDLHGFSILSRNKESGGYVCDVFVVRMIGALVDNDRTVTFGHEVLHCFGLQHE